MARLDHPLYQLPGSSPPLAQYVIYYHPAVTIGLISYALVRVWRPAIYARLYHSMRNLIESPTQRVARLTHISPVGHNPFEAQTLFRTRATPDACDFNIHLSNSSYAMVSVEALKCEAI